MTHVWHWTGDRVMVQRWCNGGAVVVRGAVVWQWFGSGGSDVGQWCCRGGTTVVQ